MTTTATKPRKKPARPAVKPRPVLVAVPPMPSYDALVAELGIDPDAVCADYDREREDCGWQPWTIRGVWEVITGRTDWTAWTVGDAQALRELTAAPEPAPVDEPTSLLGLLDDLTTEIPLPDQPEETR